MKKVFTLIVGLMLTMNAFAQKTVAVYVTSSEGVSQETNKVLGSELVAAITKTADYIAVERTADFMAQVAKEQGNYEIDDAALYDLGRKFGASNVCVADVTKFGDEYYIVARLLDIKTSKVWKTAKQYSTLNSLRELITTSETLASELFGNTKEFSTYAYGDNVDNNSYIVSIDNRGLYTNVTMKYVSVNPQQRLGIADNTYIEDMDTHQKYNLIDAINIDKVNHNNNAGKLIGRGIWEYHLLFERIPDGVYSIIIVEPNGRKYNDIVLRPYGDESTFIFEDNTQKAYDDMLVSGNNGFYKNEALYVKDRTIYRNGDKLNDGELRSIFANSKSYDLYDKGYRMIENSDRFMGAGLGVFIASAPLWLAGIFGDMDNFMNNPMWITAACVDGVGIGLIVTGAILPSVGKTKIRTAVNLYNNGQMYSQKGKQIECGFTGNGIRLALTF